MSEKRGNFAQNVKSCQRLVKFTCYTENVHPLICYPFLRHMVSLKIEGHLPDKKTSVQLMRYNNCDLFWENPP